MGNNCVCFNVPINQQNEFQIGSGAYSFKKAVCINNIITIFGFIYLLFSILQFLAKTNSQNKYYGKDELYDNEIRDRINRADSLIREGVINYMNGTVQVIIPYHEENL